MTFRSYLDGCDEVHGARDLDGGPGRARLGHRARVRRVHAVPRRPRVHRALDRAHAPLAGPLPRLARASTAPRARSSTGSSRAASTRTCAAPPRRRSPRATRSAGSRSAARSARTRRRCSQSSEWTIEELPERRAAAPARDRRDRRPRARRRARHRHLRLRDADPDRPPRHGRRARPGQALARGPGQGALADGRRAAAGGLPVPGLRARLLPRLPALPAARPRADRPCGC